MIGALIAGLTVAAKAIASAAPAAISSAATSLGASAGTAGTIGTVAGGVVNGSVIGAGLGAGKAAIAGEDVGKGAAMGAAGGAAMGGAGGAIGGMGGSAAGGGGAAGSGIAPTAQEALAHGLSVPESGFTSGGMNLINAEGAGTQFMKGMVGADSTLSQVGDAGTGALTRLGGAADSLGGPLSAGQYAGIGQTSGIVTDPARTMGGMFGDALQSGSKVMEAAGRAQVEQLPPPIVQRKPKRLPVQMEGVNTAIAQNSPFYDLLNQAKQRGYQQQGVVGI